MNSLQIKKRAFMNLIQQDDDISTWEGIQKVVRAGRANKFFKVDDGVSDGRISQLTVNKTVGGTTEQLVFDVIGIDHDTPSDTMYRHSLTLQLHGVFGNDSLVYDSPEAAFYIDENVHPHGLAAGTYWFAWNYTSGSITQGDYHFTLNSAIPVGGQIYIDASRSSLPLTDVNVKTYASVGLSSLIETASISSGQSGTNIGTIRQTSKTTTINAGDRILSGSNNYLESGLRQWINASGSNWWQPQTVFDTPTNRTADGFLTGFDADFLNVIGRVKKATQLSVADGYGVSNSDELIFLLSQPEVYGGIDRDADGTPYEYYSKRSSLSAPGTGTDTNRTKRLSSIAKSWWLRTPVYNNAFRFRHLAPNGSFSVTGAYYKGVCAAPACCIV